MMDRKGSTTSGVLVDKELHWVSHKGESSTSSMATKMQPKIGFNKVRRNRQIGDINDREEEVLSTIVQNEHRMQDKLE